MRDAVFKRSGYGKYPRGRADITKVPLEINRIN